MNELWRFLSVTAFYKNLALLMLHFLKPARPAAIETSFHDFLDKVESGEVYDVTIEGPELRGTYTTGKSFKIVLPPQYPDLVKDLRAKKVKIKSKLVKNSAWNFIAVWAPFILMAVWFMFIIRNMQAGGNKALSFGKSKARLL